MTDASAAARLPSPFSVIAATTFPCEGVAPPCLTRLLSLDSGVRLTTSTSDLLTGSVALYSLRNSAPIDVCLQDDGNSRRRLLSAVEEIPFAASFASLSKPHNPACCTNAARGIAPHLATPTAAPTAARFGNLHGLNVVHMPYPGAAAAAPTATANAESTASADGGLRGHFPNYPSCMNTARKTTPAAATAASAAPTAAVLAATVAAATAVSTVSAHSGFPNRRSLSEITLPRLLTGSSGELPSPPSIAAASKISGTCSSACNISRSFSKAFTTMSRQNKNKSSMGDLFILTENDLDVEGRSRGFSDRARQDCSGGLSDMACEGRSSGLSDMVRIMNQCSGGTSSLGDFLAARQQMKLKSREEAAAAASSGAVAAGGCDAAQQLLPHGRMNSCRNIGPAKAMPSSSVPVWLAATAAALSSPPPSCLSRSYRKSRKSSQLLARTSAASAIPFNTPRASREGNLFKTHSPLSDNALSDLCPGQSL